MEAQTIPHSHACSWEGWGLGMGLDGGGRGERGPVIAIFRLLTSNWYNWHNLCFCPATWPADRCWHSERGRWRSPSWLGKTECSWRFSGRSATWQTEHQPSCTLRIAQTGRPNLQHATAQAKKKPLSRLEGDSNWRQRDITGCKSERNF